jgi:hypothetical protein
VHIIESAADIDRLIGYITTDQMVIDPVCVDADKHACNNSISLLFFYFVTSDSYWCLPVKHYDAICLKGALDKLRDPLRISIHKKYAFDKKSLVQLLGEDFDFIDLGLLRYLNDGTIDETDYKTNAHVFMRHNFRNVPNTEICVPLTKHARAFVEKVTYFKNSPKDGDKDTGFMFVNFTMTKCFAELERNGLAVTDDFTDEFGNEQGKHVKDGLVFTQYNFLTSTGRPSNRFAGVNYAALPKEDNSRNCFVSRYGNDGMLVMMDYNAFHPRLIAHLSNFDLGKTENPYAYLAQYYFNKPASTVNEEDVAVSKGFTFTQIYGGFSEKWLHIPYFAKIQHYIDHRWKFFNEYGYIETPKYRRKIKPCHIGEANPNKLFNYILQAFETEMAVDTLNELQVYLRGKKTLPVLYTYDSILFDAHKEDGMETIKRIKEIMEGDKFPVKISVGRNYKEMSNVNV